MNPRQLLLLLLFFFFSLLEPTITFSLDERFEACVPKTCGNGQNISYPFYIQGKQKPFCGQPGFELTCGHNGFPILTLMYTPYTIHQIFYHNNSLRLSNPIFSQPNASSCIGPTQNLTVGRYIFRLAPNQRDLFVLYGCDPAVLPERVRERMIGCSAAGNETTLVVGLDKDDLDLVTARESCNGGAVNATVEDLKGGVREALWRGFMLIWNATSCRECENSEGRCGFDLDPLVYAFRCYCPDRPHVVKCNPGTKWLSKAAKIVIEVESGSVYFGVPLFSYKELAEATNRFDLSKQIGDGGFGTVYYGKLKDGREVAVKHLYNHNYRRVEQFMNEIQILTRLRHRNLVSLYGCTSRQSRELLLVYEYIPNGTVASHLHGELAKPGLLTWSLRMKIAVETASALAYLHASKIIHRDIKTNNILLDNSFYVKVADFGLSRLFPNDMTHVSTAPQGTPGYVDPEYHQCYQLTSKSDVYSFGVVLIELISSMPAVDMNRHKDEINLSNLAIKKIQERALSELVDPYLGFDSDTEVKRMIIEATELAFQCLQQDRELRPSMDEVLEVLKRIESGKDELKHLEEAVHGSGVSHNNNVTTSTELDEAGLLKNRKPPSSPISVPDSRESKSTTPNASS
ncbi:hypothetical protein GLYMA_19G073200v4 [Glycine max]|uniref:non-specific serine/threonine protein kinase n=1 Tax=Glycine max TaxID=3847 RepID=A0A0R0EVX8_SOYBN|nr:LEAF RUST 10 DISEASE-RESISTANCE LOCUS RECEPTOR-LIKE PROTEIN KINASE-like 1.2 isoform X2 [Glycine max]KAH1076762.1 hypothetical protein GYH30_052322 [Glycine max]KRG94286.1 hypothetical protein GLYMA_19G073200v4 [Glycine max]|eukprot:XP_006604085.1 LEAF RUST 10 DISEASE-RESISTANCE LOCUS RECEPTOR-LIKE PROTEIN KINASE-like 1.2 isoform X2 [Glycine max]